MSLRFLLRDADHGYLQALANDFSDLPHQYSLFSDRVVPASRFALLECKSVEMGNIANMRRRPAIESFADVCRGPLFTGHPDQRGDEALLDRVVNLRKTHYRYIHTTLRHGSAGDFRQSTGMRVVGIEMVFGCGLTWNGGTQSRSRGDYQGAIRSRQRVSKSFYRAPVLFTDLHELREVASAECAVIESTVNHPFRLGCSAAQTFRVFQISSVHPGSRGDERLGTGIGPCQSKHLMTRFDELRNDGRSDKTRSPCKKYTHSIFSFRSVRIREFVTTNVD